jgi:hypothetical protein
VVLGVGPSGVNWRVDGSFAAIDGEGRRILGWGEDVEVVAELLGRLCLAVDRDELVRVGGEGRRSFPRAGFGYPFDFTEDIKSLLSVGHPRLDELLEHLTTIRREIPTSEAGLQGWIDERAAQLQLGSPQVPTIQAFGGDFAVENLTLPKSRLRGLAEFCDWVDPRLIVCTPDRVWNDFGGRRSEVVPAIVRGVREAATDDARRAWISQMYWADSLPDLIRVEGPAGPIYDICTGGSHRTHAARILDLPCVPAEVHLAEPSYPTAPGFPWEVMDQIWNRLRVRHVLTAEVVPSEDLGVVWLPRKVSGQWMLLAPGLAVSVNRAYEQLYPGSLSRLTGVPAEDLVDEQRWTAALIKPARWQRIASRIGIWSRP